MKLIREIISTPFVALAVFVVWVVVVPLIFIAKVVEGKK